MKNSIQKGKSREKQNFIFIGFMRSHWHFCRRNKATHLFRKQNRLVEIKFYI